MLSPDYNARLWNNGARLVLITFAIAAAFFIKDLKNVSISSGDSSLWLPEGTRDSKILQNFTHKFGVEDMLLVSWEGCRFDDPKLQALANHLTEKDKALAEAEGRPGFFKVVITYEDTRDQIWPGALSESEVDQKVHEQLKGFLIGSDLETGVIVFEGTAYCAAHREEAFEFVDRHTTAFLGSDIEPKYAGPLFLSVCASKETRRTLVIVTPIVAMVSLIVALVLLRNLVMALLSFIVSGMAALMSMAAIHYGGKDLGDMLAVVPSLAQLLAMSNAVHFINYYSEDWLRHKDETRAWRYSLNVGLLPTLAAALTTIVGFAALSTSNLGVAVDFALYGSIGVFCAALTVILVVPSVLILFRPKVKEPLPFEKHFIEFLMLLSNRYRRHVAIGMTVFLIVCGTGLSRLQSDVRLETFFPEKSEFRQHYDWFLNHFGSPQVSEVIVSFPEGMREVRAVERFELIQDLTREIAALDDEYAVFSASIFAAGAPDLIVDGKPAPNFPNEFIYTKVLGELRKSDWIKVDNNREYWRISVRHPPSANPKDSKFFSHIKPLLERAEARLDPRPEITLTGAYKLFSDAQDGLLTQLLRTFLYAFVIITPIIIIFLRCFNLGLIAILGNLFPLVVFFGLMGWAGQRIDIATMMIAAVAFGIAVDDTVHFLTWLGRGFNREHELGKSIRFAFENSAGAILQTTLIISIGMMAFLLSNFKPSVRFATFSSTVLLIALIGDLIFLPALIRCLNLKSMPFQIKLSMNPVATFGRYLIGITTYLADLGKFAVTSFYTLSTSKPRIKLCCEQAVSIGLQSQLLIIVTGIFTGAVFAAQMYFAFSGYGLGTTVGAVVSITVCRELAPVLTGLMISGRVGTAMVAQIGGMKSSQQVDALKCMGVDPVEYLVVPRLTGMLISSPILNVIAMGCGIISSQYIAVYLFKVPSEWYSYQTWINTNIPDMIIGITKGVFFGVIVVLVACHQGLRTPGGTDGIGKAIKSSVVATALIVVIMNLFLSLALNLFFPLHLKNY
ncbi:MAG: ABC transporter permease [Verrucomicrobiales bacterium]|nr:ABC transporter permease [Verrucomicrobiales bacterium]